MLGKVSFACYCHHVDSDVAYAVAGRERRPGSDKAATDDLATAGTEGPKEARPGCPKITRKGSTDVGSRCTTAPKCFNSILPNFLTFITMELLTIIPLSFNYYLSLIVMRMVLSLVQQWRWMGSVPFGGSKFRFQFRWSRSCSPVKRETVHRLYEQSDHRLHQRALREFPCWSSTR